MHVLYFICIRYLYSLFSNFIYKSSARTQIHFKCVVNNILCNKYKCIVVIFTKCYSIFFLLIVSDLLLIYMMHIFWWKNNLIVFYKSYPNCTLTFDFDLIIKTLCSFCFCLTCSDFLCCFFSLPHYLCTFPFFFNTFGVYFYPSCYQTVSFTHSNPIL